MDDQLRHTRRRLFKLLAALPAAAALILVSARAADAGPVPKKQADYQDNPKTFQRCSACKFWIMGHTAVGQGTCRIVDGQINPNGWCKYFAPLEAF